MGNGTVTVENCWFLKKLNMALPFDPAITLLCIFPRALKTGVQAKLCT